MKAMLGILLCSVCATAYASPVVSGKADSEGRLEPPSEEFLPIAAVVADDAPLPSGLLPDALVEMLVQERRWEELLGYLKEYRQQNGHDPVLADFAEAAALRGLNRPAEALLLYRGILAVHPDYRFVRLAYAQALFENRNLSEADREFAAVGLEGLVPATERMIGQYRQAVAEAVETQFEVEANYERSDNVNQVGESPTLTLNGLTFQKHPDSLPQQDSGIRYGLGVRKNWLLGGNHQLHARAELNGIHYFKHGGFNEQNVRLYGGYAYRSARHHADFGPTAAYGLYGGDSYNRSIGWQMQYGYLPTRRHQLRFRYQTHYTDYHASGVLDGWRHHGSVSLFYRPANYAFYGSLMYGSEHTRDPVLRNDRYGVSVGGEYRYVSGFGVSGNISVSRRTFERPHGLYPRTVRQDTETGYRIGLFHEKIQWRGFMPVLNGEYYRVRSNLPDLYNRSTHQLYFSVQRQF